MYLGNFILRQWKSLTDRRGAPMMGSRQESGGCSSEEVIAVTLLETLALLNLIAVVIFGILGYIKK